MIDVQAIARHYGGKVCKGNALIPTPGHSSRDRGTAIMASALAPDGCLVACYNGTTADALAVKDMLRKDGFICSTNERARELTAPERRSIREAECARKRKRLALEEMAASGAEEIWRNAGRADPAHPYLVRKAIAPFGIRQSGNSLCVPMVDTSFRLWNVQRIRPDGSKLFLKDGRTAGLLWPHGVHMKDGRQSDGPLVIGEGFATMAAVHEATGYGVAAALSVKNLLAVALVMRRTCPDREIILAADHDGHLRGNIGLEAAQEAAGHVGGFLASPVAAGRESDSAGLGIDFADIPRADAAALIERARAGKAVAHG